MSLVAPDHTLAPSLPGSGCCPGEVCLVSTTQQRYFSNPLETHIAYRIEEVAPLLDYLDGRVQQDGLYVAGYMAYEAAPAFDAALCVNESKGAPLCWFSLYEEVETSIPDADSSLVPETTWRAEITQPEFDDVIARIRNYIGAGDTYQVNYTFPMETHFDGDPYAWFRQINAAQRAAYSAYIDAGSHQVLSISPESFFTLDGDRLTTKPMKGTIARGMTLLDDKVQAEKLRASKKDRAENIMIVDLLRNDMGRVSKTGSVEVTSLFDVERYDSLWQMTSTITSKSVASVPEIFAALFPSGSVTGAPKIRTSEIIREIEEGPRGAYCGAIGYWGPNRQAEFNVAIRTATYHPEAHRMVYSVGAGITWDSSSSAEYEECLLKAKVVTDPKSSFDLLESLLWDGDYFLLERHLRRLSESADYFGYDWDEEQIRNVLKNEVKNLPQRPHKVRVTLSRKGVLRCASSPIDPEPRCRIKFSARPIQQDNVFLYHKTTARDVYESALKNGDSDDVILWNERGEVTESTRANVVAKVGGVWKTPPVSCGLLAGTYRDQLLEEGIIEEGILTKEDLIAADEVQLINSVRKWIPIEWVSDGVR